ncbi:MAG: SAM-dependent methyltransferase [Gammaproteobacteria bacterium]|nr:SAM-dependent methyltransferase [Gammaproteobacteria bacterium]
MSKRHFNQQGQHPQGVDSVSDLPEPDACAQEVCNHLQQKVLAEIEQSGGSISFARYMEMALYEPGLGYYAAGSQKFGTEGDFVTAPEISPLFAKCLARQCQQVLEAMQGGVVFEFGAGSGVLAADLLRELEELACLPEKYLILELSPELRVRQRATLQKNIPHLLERVQWLDKMPDQDIKGVVIANEVLDAMPVQRFHVDRSGTSGCVQQIHIRRSSKEEDSPFNWCYVPADEAIVAQVEKIQQDCAIEFADGYESELQMAYEPWLQTLSDHFSSGAVFLIDYGYPGCEYYLQERHSGTLMCHYRHRAHADPLILTGLQDITAYVDFTAVAEAALNAGFEVSGFTPQAHFLLGCGLDELMSTVDPEDTQKYLKVSQQAKTLTLPGEMGERFKVLGLTKELDLALRGFSLQDHRHRL